MRTDFDVMAAELADRAEQRAAAPKRWQTRPLFRDTGAPFLVVLDDVVKSVQGYRQEILSQTFRDVQVGPALFKGIAMIEDRLAPVLRRICPTAAPVLTFARKSPAGQEEPNYIHTDTDMGSWTAILYLTPRPAEGDGTLFWKHTATGAKKSTADDEDSLKAEALEWRNIPAWSWYHFVPARFNRLVLFDSSAFHSRAIPENYGTGDEARLIQVMFGRWV